MTFAFTQQDTGQPTTPTPYPDGLIVHQVDGATIYPEAFTGVRPVETQDAWYNHFGFYFNLDEYSEGWSWYGVDYLGGWLYGELAMILMWVVVFTWIALPFLPGVNPRRFRAFLGWAGCITLGAAGMFLLGSDIDGDLIAFNSVIVPAGLLYWWSSSSARSWRARTLRIAVAAILLLFPWLPLGLLIPVWHSDEAIWATACFATMLPLALSKRTDLMDGPQRWLVASVPILFFFIALVGDQVANRFPIAWASHAIPMIIAAFLVLRPGTKPARPAIA